MEYRTVPKTCDNLSVLGFGCMRLPTLGNDAGLVGAAMVATRGVQK